jgi:hypothetical protein
VEGINRGFISYSTMVWKGLRKNTKTLSSVMIASLLDETWTWYLLIRSKSAVYSTGTFGSLGTKHVDGQTDIISPLWILLVDFAQITYTKVNFTWALMLLWKCTRSYKGSLYEAYNKRSLVGNSFVYAVCADNYNSGTGFLKVLWSFGWHIPSSFFRLKQLQRTRNKMTQRFLFEDKLL